MRYNWACTQAAGEDVPSGQYRVGLCSAGKVSWATQRAVCLKDQSIRLYLVQLLKKISAVKNRMPANRQNLTFFHRILLLAFFLSKLVEIKICFAAVSREIERGGKFNTVVFLTKQLTTAHNIIYLCCQILHPPNWGYPRVRLTKTMVAT